LQALLDERDDKRITARRALADNLAILSPADFTRICGLIASLATATRRAARSAALTGATRRT